MGATLNIYLTPVKSSIEIIEEKEMMIARLAFIPVNFLVVVPTLGHDAAQECFDYGLGLLTSVLVEE